MTRKEHIKIHEELHKNLDNLISDFLEHTKKLPSETTVRELMEWAFKQTTNPDG